MTAGFNFRANGIGTFMMRLQILKRFRYRFASCARQFFKRLGATSLMRFEFSYLREQERFQFFIGGLLGLGWQDLRVAS